MSQVNAVAIRNEKPQGKAVNNVNGHHTTLSQSKARYEKGLELYKEGKVSINPNGYGFKVNGFVVDTEIVRCECPDYQSQKEACKHFFAACQFQKNGCRVRD